MKILLTLDFPPQQGGIQQYLFSIVRFCYDQADLVIVGCGRKQKSDFKKLKTPVHRISAPLGTLNKKLTIPLLAIHVLSTIRHVEGKEVLIECGNVYAAAAAWIVSLVKPLPYFVYTYGTELVALKKRSVKTALLRHVLQKAKTIFVLGEYTAGLVRETGSIAPLVIRPPKIFLPDLGIRAPKPVSDGKNTPFTILCVGRFVPHKGQQVLLSAALLLPHTFTWEVVLVGNGPLKNELAQFCFTNKIQDNVRICSGFTDQQRDSLYDRSDVLVVPSLNLQSGVEGFGIVLLEAMARRLPVIASRCGGIPEVLDNGACGVLVEPGNAAELAAAIVRLHDDCPLNNTLAQRAYTRLVDTYAWRE